MVSKKDLNAAELETMRTSRSPTTVMTANGEVQTREEMTENVSNCTSSSKLCFFKKLQLFFPWGNCEDHGYTYHWTSGQIPHLIRNGKRIESNIYNYVPFVVPALSASSSSITPSPSSVPERSGSMSEELRGDKLHESTEPKTNIKWGIRSTKRYIA